MTIYSAHSTKTQSVNLSRKVNLKSQVKVKASNSAISSGLKLPLHGTPASKLKEIGLAGRKKTYLHRTCRLLKQLKLQSKLMQLMGPPPIQKLIEQPMPYPSSKPKPLPMLKLNLLP